MVSASHALQRDELVRRARELVKEDQLQFTLAGQRLDEKYREETARIDDPDPLGPGEKYAVEETPEQILFMRLGAALDCLRYPDQHRYDNHLDFQANASIEDRRMRARMAVLVLLAAIDPNKGEVIDSSMGEIASIPFELWEFKDNEEQPSFGGSAWTNWSEPGWDHPNEPSPGVLKVFQHAIDVAKHGSIEAARKSRIPSGDGRPCDHDGKNWADECERSLRDLLRFVCHFHYCVTHYRKEWPFRFEEDTCKELLEIKIDNRTWWKKWADVIKRARESITSIDRSELASAKQRAFEALCVIADAYQEPLMYQDDEQEGDHLFRRAQGYRTGDEDAKRLQTLSKALDDLEPLRRGCGLYLDEVQSASDAEVSDGQDEAEMKSDVEDPPTDVSKKKGRRRTKAEIERDNRLLTIFLIENPTGTKDQAAELIGVSTGTIANSSPWQRRQLLRRENSKEARPMHIEDLDALADSKSSQIRDSNGALPRDSVKIRASHSRRR